MSMEQMFPVVLLLGLLGIAVASDVRRHRIPNFLVVLGLALGLAGHGEANCVRTLVKKPADIRSRDMAF